MGKTWCPASGRLRAEKHPHVRGEDIVVPNLRRGEPETPPRAWGRQDGAAGTALREGNTPTCVGKTWAISVRAWLWRKHPHVRGEDDAGNATAFLFTETPPRAWGRPRRIALLRLPRRNTPTCVGKTGSTGMIPGTAWKHPHVRGEDRHGTTATERLSGNTPTCVGKTLADCALGAVCLETPPRAWGRH